MNYILTTECTDDVGLIAKITNLCFEHTLNITRNNEFVDTAGQRFFMRTELTG
ncbi:formyltetrahydrofolate deformylase, partial [Pseudoalteromonas ruthenica]